MNPNLGQRIKNYMAAIEKLYSKKNTYRQRTGRRLLSLDLIKERLEICKPCEHFNGLRCKKCGCCTDGKETHFNKLAFPTESCPEGYWKGVS